MDLNDLRQDLKLFLALCRPLTFSSLPFEVKAMMYEYAFHEQGVFEKKIYVDRTRGGISSTLTSCRQGFTFTHREACEASMPIFFRHAVFYMYRGSDVYDLRGLLRNVPVVDGMALLRHAAQWNGRLLCRRPV